MSEILTATTRTKLKRLPKRGRFERETIDRILDEAFVCHIGFVAGGQPFVIPTSYARDGDRLIVHGSAASRMMRVMSEGVDVCLTVTLIDALVLARSAFHHSVNYRSVVVFGRAAAIEDEDEKRRALELLTDHIVPRRSRDVRPPTALELKATTVLRLSLDEASAKIRSGPPVDDEEDYALDVWAGLLPLSMTAGAPVADARLRDGVAVPPEILHYRRMQ